MSLAAREPEGSVRAVSACAYRVPTDQPEADGTIAWDATTVVVVRATCGDTVGVGWTYGAAACAAIVREVLEAAVRGTDAMDVVRANEAMVRACRNVGRSGVAGCAISAVDMALWDLKARLLEVPLSSLFGRCRDEVPVYGSGGFTTYDDATTTAQLERFTGDWGCRAVKLKIGESFGSDPERDLARIALARSVVGDGVDLLVDANGGYARKQAVAIGRRLHDDDNVSWFEEPVSSEDLVGLGVVRDALDLEVAAGEYLYDEREAALLVPVVDVLQIDATRCGGYTSWLRIAALAAAANLEVSAHCAPTLHAQVAPAVPNLRHLEYFYDHHRVDGILFEGALTVAGGVLVPDATTPGNGVEPKRSELEALRVA